MHTVFIVDDEQIIREGLCGYDWASVGFDVVGHASNGQAALELIRESRPDVVLTDIRMPYLDGLELGKQVKQDLPDAKVVLLSGYSDFEYAKKAIGIGVAEYLVKPINIAELRETFSKLNDSLNEEKNLTQKEATLPSEQDNLSISIAKQYIEQHFAQKLSLKEIADTVYLTPSYFSLLFKKSTGENVIDYLKKVRIEQAKLLLKRPDHKVYDVAAKVGYDNPKYFTDMFKKYTGMSPLEYKNKC